MLALVLLLAGAFGLSAGVPGVVAEAAAAPDAGAYERAVVLVVTASATDSEVVFGSGTGFFVDDRHVVTNQHVVAEAEAAAGRSLLFIVPSGGDEPLLVSIVWSDAGLDLALLAYEGGDRHGALRLAGGELREGSDVYAVGYPGSAGRAVGGPIHSTLTDGILSRPPFEGGWGAGGAATARILQHTAAINPGNSGGPLLDACGGVVGINTSGGVAAVRDADGKVVGATAAQGIFFALHVSELQAVLGDLGVRYSSTGACAGGGTPFTGTAAGTDPLTVALLGAVLLAMAVMLFRRPREAVVAGAGRSASAVAEAVSEVVGARSMRGPSAVGGGGSVRFDGQAGAADLALEAGALRDARHGLSVGRDGGLVDCPVRVEGLSRRHFRVSIHRGRAFVEDLNSTNGTYVNGQRQTPYRARQLKAGDVISAGDGRWHYTGRE